MRISTLIYISILLFICKGYAQQDPMYSQYLFDKMAINPAFVGSTSSINATLTHRNQFVGLTGAPVTQKLTVSTPIQSKSMGVGLKVANDKIGVTNTLMAGLIYSYHLGLGSGKLSFGLEGGIINQTVDFNGLIKTHENDQTIPIAMQSILVPDVSFGMIYRTEKLFLGGTIYHMLDGKLDYSKVARQTVAHTYKHYFLSGGYKFSFSEKIDFQPSFLVKSVQAAPTQVDINATTIYNNTVAAGVSYRTNQSLVFLAKYMWKETVFVGYSYDVSMSGLSNYTNGSHEIVLGYQYNLLPPARDKVTDPRYYF